MKRGLYIKLAVQSIRKNKRLYIPYILTCIYMIMIFYITSFLVNSGILSEIRGGFTMRESLVLGRFIIAIFSLIFLFYANSFLIKRRKKEFGLYNILGMGKRNIAKVLLNESIIIAVISLIGGLFTGVLLSGFSKLGMLKILKADIEYSTVFDISFSAVAESIVFFTIIFLLILINALRQVHFSKPIELLRSENTGEKPPKANWVISVIGLIILAVAYYMALSVKNPIKAVTLFFVAVVLVIISTYMLFISGSVALCKILQKNKKYYYKINHFVSVSSMLYRMKRNGASLASICILCTMVLVMISSVAGLYVGLENGVRDVMGRDISIVIGTNNIKYLNEKVEKTIKNVLSEILSEENMTAKDIIEYNVISFEGYINGQEILDGNDIINNINIDGVDKISSFYLVPISDYNKIMGKDEKLNRGEVLLYNKGFDYNYDKIKFSNIGEFKIKKKVDSFVSSLSTYSPQFLSSFIFISDIEFEECWNSTGEMINDGIPDEQYYQNTSKLFKLYQFDLDCSDEKEIYIEDKIHSLYCDNFYDYNDDLDSGYFLYSSTSSVAREKEEILEIYGSLLFLGIILGMVFIFAMILIMYYKQITEGYEDQSRFSIMQKVGMTKKEIKKSINSQILTVFFLPILIAGVHLIFSFNMIGKVLSLISLASLGFLGVLTLICFLIFAVFYILIYIITSKAYYSIVKSSDNGD